MENHLKLETEKDFSVKKEILYKAWTSENDLKQWWKPMGNHLTKVVNDLKPDGEVSYHFENNDNDEAFTITGEYEEVIENEKLIYTWMWNLPGDNQIKSDFKLHISFVEDGDKATLKVVQENIQDEEALKTQRESWNKALVDLENFLQQNSEQTEEKPATNSEEGESRKTETTDAADDIEGYDKNSEVI